VLTRLTLPLGKSYARIRCDSLQGQIYRLDPDVQHFGCPNSRLRAASSDCDISHQLIPFASTTSFRCGVPTSLRKAGIKTDEQAVFKRSRAMHDVAVVRFYGWQYATWHRSNHQALSFPASDNAESRYSSVSSRPSNKRMLLARRVIEMQPAEHHLYNPTKTAADAAFESD